MWRGIQGSLRTAIYKHLREKYRLDGAALYSAGKHQIPPICVKVVPTKTSNSEDPGCRLRNSSAPQSPKAYPSRLRQLPASLIFLPTRSLDSHLFIAIISRVFWSCIRVCDGFFSPLHLRRIPERSRSWGIRSSTSFLCLHVATTPITPGGVPSMRLAR